MTQRSCFKDVWISMIFVSQVFSSLSHPISFRSIDTCDYCALCLLVPERWDGGRSPTHLHTEFDRLATDVILWYGGCSWLSCRVSIFFFSFFFVAYLSHWLLQYVSLKVEAPKYSAGHERCLSRTFGRSLWCRWAEYVLSTGNVCRDNWRER
jgi:hypothetical protein